MSFDNVVSNIWKENKCPIMIWIVFQSIFSAMNFFIGIDGFYWKELIFSLIVVIPWILPLLFYLNFQQLPLNRSMIQIRMSCHQRIKYTFRIIVVNLLLSEIPIIIIALISILIHNSIEMMFFLGIEMIVKYSLFLMNASLLQLIVMKLYKNKGMLSVVLYIIFFICSYSSYRPLVQMIFPPLYPAFSSIYNMILPLGYFLVLSAVYMFIEERKEYVSGG